MYRRILLKHVIRFTVTGVLNTFIDFFILNAAMLISGITSGVSLFFFNMISFSSALANSYLLNNNWTFTDEERTTKSKVLKFMSVSLFSMLVNSGIVYVLTTLVSPACSIPELLRANGAKALATIVSFACNFLGYNYLVFPGKVRR